MTASSSRRCQPRPAIALPPAQKDGHVDRRRSVTATLVKHIY